MYVNQFAVNSHHLMYVWVTVLYVNICCCFFALQLEHADSSESRAPSLCFGPDYKRPIIDWCVSGVCREEPDWSGAWLACWLERPAGDLLAGCHEATLAAKPVSWRWGRSSRLPFFFFFLLNPDSNRPFSRWTFWLVKAGKGTCVT